MALPAVANDHTLPPVEPATSFAAVEVHAKEQVAIAAEPYDTKQKESIFRVDYLGHGVMPIRLIVTNNGQRQERVLASEEERQRVLREQFGISL